MTEPSAEMELACAVMLSERADVDLRRSASLQMMFLHAHKPSSVPQNKAASYFASLVLHLNVLCL